MDSTDDSIPSKASTEDDVQSEDVQSISRSSREQLQDSQESVPDPQDANNMERHRNMMLASLLEDYYRSRALEFLNAANPAQRYSRRSPEIEAATRQLFSQATQVLSTTGLLSPRAISDDFQRVRQQYLSGLDSLVAGSQTPNILDSMRDLMAQTSQLDLAAHPANDLQLTLHQPQPPPPQSHYRSAFREDRLLGKGGFGKVYACYNQLDHKTYAVKKVTLPPTLVKSLSDGRHEDLQHVLREVQAMAMLEHPNIVRYHATWFELPQKQPELLSGLDDTNNHIRRPLQHLLLDSHAFSHDDEKQEPSVSGGIVFGADTTSSRNANTNDRGMNEGWSEDASLGLSVVDTTSASESNFFAGGDTDSNENESALPQDATGTNQCALYIQMSMYPLTLAQFIAPPSSSKTNPRHCFHLAPTLRLILRIHEGLQYIHSKGLIHRDIKPGNIFLSDPSDYFDGGYCDLSCKTCTDSTTRGWLNPRIGDFGLVHQLAAGEVPTSSQSSAETKEDAGTAYYQPPRAGGRKDEKIDIFALGVVLVEMLCRCNTVMQRVDMLKGLQCGELPPELRENIENEGHHDSTTADLTIQLVSSMVEADPERRWSGSRVRDALQDLVGRCCGI